MCAHTPCCPHRRSLRKPFQSRMLTLLPPIAVLQGHADWQARAGVLRPVHRDRPRGLLQRAAGGSRLTAAIPMDNPYCSCKLTRVRSGAAPEAWDDRGRSRVLRSQVAHTHNGRAHTHNGRAHTHNGHHRDKTTTAARFSSFAPPVAALRCLSLNLVRRDHRTDTAQPAQSAMEAPTARTAQPCWLALHRG